MRWFGRAWRHDRWVADLAAYVDGELSGTESGRFEAHLDGCETCRAAVAQERALKRLLAENLVEARAPRSFAITEAMLERSGQPVRGAAGAPVLAMRFAQVAVAAAVIGFVSLVVIDRGTNGSGSANRTAAPMSAESGAAGAIADSPGPDASPTRESGNSKSAATVVPPYSPGGVQGQSAASPVPQAPAAVADSYNYAPVQPSEGTGTAGGVVAAPAVSPVANSGTNWFRIAEGALVLFTIVALGSYFVARRANRRSSDV